ncbi:FabD/lysophospholipase-like protein, partial [Serendipita vermifera]
MDLYSGPKRWRIVSFDGGGPGCYSQLLIMSEIMKRLKYDFGFRNGDLYPADYFEMMGGVGFGGLIAVLLGWFRLTVKQAIDEFHILASALFTGTHTGPLNPTFNTENLKKYVEGVLERRGLPLDVDFDNKRFQSSACKIVLVTTSSNNVTSCRLFRSYPLDHGYDDCTLVDALCTTMFVPIFFDPAPTGLNLAGQQLTGGGFSFSNPTRVIFNEASGIFGEYDELGIILSLGSGLSGLLSLDDSNLIPETMETLLIHLGRNSEIIAREVSTQFTKSGEYTRIDVNQGMENILFHDWSTLGRVETHTQAYLQLDIPNKLLHQSAEKIKGNF